VRDAIDAELDVDTWNRYVRAEAAERESITGSSPTATQASAGSTSVPGTARSPRSI
jgi:hypothetical protein